MTPVICTVDAVLLTLCGDELHVALHKRERAPFQGLAALPGGYVHAEADLCTRDAALRVLQSKTGIDVPWLEQLATFSGPARDPRGWSVSIAYYALVPYALIASTSRTDVQLVSVDRLHTLPFDHTAIVNTAVARLRSKSQYSSLPCFLAGDAFTLPQLQRVDEVLLGGPLNKVSFRRKMAEMDVLEEADGMTGAADAHRPAQLYRLKARYRDALRLLKRGL